MRWLIVLALVACSGKKEPPKATASGSAPSGGSAPAAAVKFVDEWNVVAVNGMCSANDLAPCPDKECVPTPRAIECPAGLTDGNARVVQLEDKSCVTAPEDCKTSACLGPKTPCPLPKGEAFPALSWAVTAMGDGTCTASSQSPTGVTAITVHCPIADAAFTIKRAKADAPCEANGKPVPCPEAPKQLTVAALRDALAKDANAFGENKRVQIKGFYVKSMIAQMPKGKDTIYMVGAADTKGDAKQAVKCTSTVPLPEAEDGADVVVEGTPKKGTSGEVSLLECRAFAPT